MDNQQEKDTLGEIIATEVNLKTLEMYRLRKDFFNVHDVDHLFQGLLHNIVDAIGEREDDSVELSLKFDPKEFERMANDCAASLKEEHSEVPAGAEVPLEDSRESTSGDSPASLSLELIEKLWSEAPEWANWWARGEDGVKCFYSKPPGRVETPSFCGWSEVIAGDTCSTVIELAPGYGWKESLRKRPTTKQNSPKSPAKEQETAPDAATATRSKSGPAEASPVIGDGVDAGAATKLPEKEAPEEKPIDQAFFDAFHAWISDSDLSYREAARRAGVSDPTIWSLAKGVTKHPTKPTKKKILAAIRKDKKAAASKAEDPKPADETPEPETSAVIDQERKGAGTFLSKQLQRWINQKKRSEQEICETLGVPREMINRILGGFIPNEDTIYALAKHLPGVAMNQVALVKLARATHKANEHGAHQ